jgi:Skp family chaperone for outer membrane proteins
MQNLCLRLLFAALAGLGAGGAGAQQASDPTIFGVQSEQSAPTILTVDIDRLFGQSQFGERIAETYNAGQLELNAENRRIADALRTEELALAAQRPDMASAVFRAEAEAFDEKAQGIRRAQDAKEAALEEILATGRAQFLDVSRPILGQLMVERGAFAILDRRSVLLSLGSIDITDDAIQSINSAIGDGTTAPPEPEPAPED